MRKERIYRIELEKALDAGLSSKEAERLASERTEEIYWSMVDQGREQAKDH